MLVGTSAFRTIWAEGDRVRIIDQTRLPHDFVVADLATLQDAATAIRDMQVRGAPLIGATAAWGIALQMAADPSDGGLAQGHAMLLATRPTAVNLRWALDDMRAALAVLARATAGRRPAPARRRSAMRMWR